MRDKKWQILTSYKQFFAILSSMALFGTEDVSAQNINAGFVMEQMSVDQQVSYIAGVVEGLAYSRYLRDKPDQSSMNCIYTWYANNTGSAEKSATKDAWFARHPDQTVAVLLQVLIKKECGE